MLLVEIGVRPIQSAFYRQLFSRRQRLLHQLRRRADWVAETHAVPTLKAWADLQDDALGRLPDRPGHDYMLQRPP
jgi:hypothetical protein